MAQIDALAEPVILLDILGYLGVEAMMKCMVKAICVIALLQAVIGCAGRQDSVSESFRKMGEDISWYFSNE